MWRGTSLIADTKENIEKDKRMENYLINNFKEEYYKFNFYDKDAQNNRVDILFSYASLTDNIKIFRADDTYDIFEESATGRYKIKKIKIKIYEKNFFSWLLGKKDTGSSITLNLDEVNHIYGELIDFTLENKTFNVNFTTDNVNIIQKSY